MEEAMEEEMEMEEDASRSTRVVSGTSHLLTHSPHLLAFAAISRFSYSTAVLIILSIELGIVLSIIHDKNHFGSDIIGSSLYKPRKRVPLPDGSAHIACTL